MKKGDIVRIYEDPVTCQKIEGAAKLLKLENDNIPEQQFWKVRFQHDYFITSRWIKRD